MFAILIPALNESSTIEQVVKESFEVTTHVFVIDDGSSDKTTTIAKKNNAIVLRNKENKGLGYSLDKGLHFIFDRKIKVVVTIDGDGAHNPLLIPGIVEYNNETKADITIGSRFSHKKIDNFFPSPKMAANILGALLLKKYCGVKLNDVASGMRVITSKYLKLPKISNDYGFAFDLLCTAQRKGFIVNDFPIEVRYDAREPFITQIPEIIAIVNTILKFSLHQLTLEPLDIFLRLVKNKETFCATIDSRIFYFFPVEAYNSYLCQEQHPAFLKLPKRETLIEL